jgi:TrmH family RNA methyltransferase
VRRIASRDNPLFKRLKAMAASAQARRKEGLSILDGAHLVEAALAAGWSPALMAVSESGLARAEIARLVEAARGEVTCLPDALFEAISAVEHGAGIVAAVATPRQELPAAIEGDCLLLEHLQDPGNMGSLLRSAAAAGISWVICSEKTVYAWSPKVLRAGQGAHFALSIAEGVDLAEALRRVRARVVATEPRASRSLFGCDLAPPVAWLFGNEGAGLSERLLALADLRVAIPMPGRAESLNVAAAGAVCMFEAVRQRAQRAGEV